VRKPYKSKGASVSLGKTPIHYQTLAQGSFCEIPKDFKKVRPLKERQELLKTNYELGSEKTEYESSIMRQFKNPKD
jgi:hypothetical protein